MSENNTVLLKTDKGDIKIKLYLEEAPITAGNFKDLVEKEFYNGKTFHRIVSGFVIQGGCPKANGTGSYVEDGKPRLIKLEETGIKHDQEGVVAMARSMDPDSASCQFFIDLTAQPGLEAGGYDPHGYAAFGQVIEGMDVVHKIANENEPMFPGDDGTTNPVTITEAVMLAEANAN